MKFRFIFLLVIILIINHGLLIAQQSNDCEHKLVLAQEEISKLNGKVEVLKERFSKKEEFANDLRDRLKDQVEENKRLDSANAELVSQCNAQVSDFRSTLVKMDSLKKELFVLQLKLAEYQMNKTNDSLNYRRVISEQNRRIKEQSEELTRIQFASETKIKELEYKVGIYASDTVMVGPGVLHFGGVESTFELGEYVVLIVDLEKGIVVIEKSSVKPEIFKKK